MSNPIVLNMNKVEGTAKVSLNMSKISLETLKKLSITVFWKENTLVGGKKYDLDLSAIFLDANGKPNIESADGYPDLLFFNSPKNAQNFSYVYDGAGVLPKDERSGGSEEVQFDYSKVPARIVSIDHYVTIFEGRQRGQSFVMMDDAKVVLKNMETDKEVQTFMLQGFTNDTALHIGSSIRNAQGNWEFQPAGTARAMNLPEIVGLYVG